MRISDWSSDVCSSDLLACTEAASDDGHRCWMRRGGLWTETRYLGMPGFDPVDMAALPSGDLLVLERSFTILGWFRNELSLVTAADLAKGGPLIGHALGPVSPASGDDNLEGMAVRLGPDGEPFVYLIVDDNFSVLQRTTLVQYRLAWRKPAI